MFNRLTSLTGSRSPLLAKLHAQSIGWFDRDEGGYENDSFKSINTPQINQGCLQPKGVLVWYQGHGNPGLMAVSGGATDPLFWFRALGAFFALDEESKA